IFLMYQTRSVFQVLTGRDGGWPASNRGDGRITQTAAAAATRWITVTGLIGLTASSVLAPGLVPWLLPVSLPMILAPFLISWFSQDSRSSLMAVPSELTPAPVIRHHQQILRAWRGNADIPPLPPGVACAGAARP
ncbi:MAG: glucan biosynthesis glucosyltransferase H, partial [Rhodobacterales bacterium]